MSVMVREIGKELAAKHPEGQTMASLVVEARCFTVEPTSKVCEGLATVLDLVHRDVFAIDDCAAGGAASAQVQVSALSAQSARPPSTSARFCPVRKGNAQRV